MPTYTNPKTGKRIKSAIPLTDDQLNEAFGVAHTGPPPKMKLPPVDNSNAPIQDVLEGAGLPKNLDALSRPAFDENTNLADVSGRADPSIGMLQSIKDRVGRAWESQANDNSPSAALKTILAAVPGIGAVSKHAHRGIPPSGPLDPHELGKMAGATAATALPFAGEIAKSLPSVPEMPGGMGGVLKSKLADAAIDGVSNTKVLGSRFNLRGAINDYKASQAARNTPLEPVASMATPPDPRIAQLRDLVLNRRLAQEKGMLPTTEAQKLNTPMSAEPLPEVPEVNAKAQELKQLQLDRKLAQEKGTLPQGDSTLNPTDVEELKRLRLQNSLAKERAKAEGTQDNSDGGGNSTPETTDTKIPEAKFKSALDSVPKLTKGKTKGTPPPATKEVPTAPNPSSKVTPHDPEVQTSEENPNTSISAPNPHDVVPSNEPPSRGLFGPSDSALPNESNLQQKARIEQIRQLQPSAGAEWDKVNELEKSGVDRIEAMRQVRAARNAPTDPNKLPSNQLGEVPKFSPRARGVNPRAKGLNPRALDNKRREP